MSVGCLCALLRARSVAGPPLATPPHHISWPHRFFELQTTSFFVPTWFLALWRLGIGLFFCASMLLEQYTSRKYLINL